MINPDPYAQSPMSAHHQQAPPLADPSQYAGQYTGLSQFQTPVNSLYTGLDAQPQPQTIGLDGIPSPVLHGPIVTHQAPLERTPRWSDTALTAQQVADIMSDTAPHPTKAVDERTYHPGFTKVPHDVYVQHAKSHGTFRKMPDNFTQKLHDDNEIRKAGKRKTANAEMVSSAAAQRAMLLDRELAELVSSTLSDPDADHAAVHHVVSVLDLATSAEYIISAIEMIFVGVQGLLAGLSFITILLLAADIGSSSSDLNGLLDSIEPYLSKTFLILIHISFVGAAVPTYRGAPGRPATPRAARWGACPIQRGPRGRPPRRGSRTTRAPPPWRSRARRAPIATCGSGSMFAMDGCTRWPRPGPRRRRPPWRAAWPWPWRPRRGAR